MKETENVEIFKKNGIKFVKCSNSSKMMKKLKNCENCFKLGTPALKLIKSSWNFNCLVVIIQNLKTKHLF